MSTLKSLRCALAICTAAFACAVQAVPVSYLAGTVVQTNDGFDVDFQQQISSSASRTYTPYGSSYESITAAANLAAGTIKVRTEGQANNATGALGPYGGAFIGDSFRHYSGTNPFNWTSSTTAQFNIHIDGTTYLDPGPGDVYNFSIVALVIYKPGMLDSEAPYCGPSVIKAFFWSIGDQPQATDPCGNSFIGNLNGSVDTDLLASFMPNGDFDWTFGVKLGGAFNGGQLPNGFASGTWINDFSNTATLGYVAPDGATVQSASGAFPGTTALQVPEPGALGLVGLGLFAAVAVRRRTQRQPGAGSIGA